MVQSGGHNGTWHWQIYGPVQNDACCIAVSGLFVAQDEPNANYCSIAPQRVCAGNRGQLLSRVRLGGSPKAACYRRGQTGSTRQKPVASATSSTGKVVSRRSWRARSSRSRGILTVDAVADVTLEQPFELAERNAGMARERRPRLRSLDAGLHGAQHAQAASRRRRRADSRRSMRCGPMPSRI